MNRFRSGRVEARSTISVARKKVLPPIRRHGHPHTHVFIQIHVRVPLKCVTCVSTRESNNNVISGGSYLIKTDHWSRYIANSIEIRFGPFAIRDRSLVQLRTRREAEKRKRPRCFLYSETPLHERIEPWMWPKFAPSISGSRACRKRTQLPVSSRKLRRLFGHCLIFARAHVREFPFSPLPRTFVFAS